MTKLINWLNSTSEFADVSPVRIKINDTTYEAASFIDTNNFGDTHVYALLGPLPACYRRNPNIKFQLPHDTRDWYVAGLSAGDENHPLSGTKNFMLVPWRGSNTPSLIPAPSPNRIPVQVSTD